MAVFLYLKFNCSIFGHDGILKVTFEWFTKQINLMKKILAWLLLLMETILMTS